MVDVELVTQLCRRAAAASGGGVLDVVRDPLDDSVWVRMSSWPRAQEASTALMTHGLSTVDRADCRLQVTGWDVRLLRRRELRRAARREQREHPSTPEPG